MGAMNVTDFGTKAKDALERVEAGEIIEITRNNRTIAELRPRRGAHQVEWNQAAREMIDIMRKGVRLGGGPYSEEDKYGDLPL